MAHIINGFSAVFTGRRSWKAHLSHRGKRVATVPVTWTKGWRKDDRTGEIYLAVWFSNDDELASMNESREPFMVAVALAKDYRRRPHEFKEFKTVLLVVPSGRLLGDQSMECRVLGRVDASQQGIPISDSPG